MILYIAEKPSLARALVAALPTPHQKNEGFIKLGNGDIVSWCIGHLLEQAQPEAYDPAFKKWSHQHLPIVPQQWKLVAEKETAKQLSVLRKWVKQASQLVHVGDPDREGQLLVDEVIHFLGVKGPKLASIKRCLINDLNATAIKRALADLRSNRDFIALSTSALTRSRADWLYGINLTRAYTPQGQKVNYQGVLSIGRVQTPVLGLVVRRDSDIENVVSHPFYEVWANLRTKDNELFKAKWSPSKSCEPYLDTEGRNVSKPLADKVVEKVSFQTATVTQLKRKQHSQAAPLPYNLSNLQIDASKRYGLSAQQVLEICQSLYEKHKAITYPRSDNRYLPLTHFPEAGGLVNTIKSNLHALALLDQDKPEDSNYQLAFSQIDLSYKSKAWNNAKVDAHHAIIPTGKRLTTLSHREAQVYLLICRHYLIQFLPHHRFFETRAEITIQSGLFIASAKEVIDPGWKIVFPKKSPTKDKPESYLPTLYKGQTLDSLQAEVLEKQTSPPKHFTDASLLTAMTGISHFVKDPELKKILKETDGLGTEATRAGIIELLFKRGFLARSGKTIKATDAGKGLISVLPESLTLPDRTARWESLLTAISQRKAAYADIMTPLTSELESLVQQSQSILPHALQGLRASNTKGKSKKAPKKRYSQKNIFNKKAKKKIQK